MSELQNFHFGEWSFRYLMLEGKPWFVVVDLCAALGLGNATKALIGTPDKDRGQAPLNTREGVYEQVNMVNIVNEPGLWRLIFKSRRPEAEQLQTFVFEEVLPALREHGYYSVHPVQPTIETPPNDPRLPTTHRGWLELSAVYTGKIAELIQENTALLPKADAHDALIGTEGLYYLKQVAMTLAQEGLISGIGSEQTLRGFLQPPQSGPVMRWGINWIFRSRGLWWARPDQLRAGRFAYRYHPEFTDRLGKQHETHSLMMTSTGLVDLRALLKRRQLSPNVRSITS